MEGHDGMTINYFMKDKGVCLMLKRKLSIPFVNRTHKRKNVQLT